MFAKAKLTKNEGMQSVSSIRSPTTALRAALLATLFLAPGFDARADWINLTGAESAPNIAEIYVRDDRVEVVLEIYVRDLALFADLVPEDFFADDVAERDSTDVRLRRFAREGIQLINEDGARLPAQLKLVEPRFRIDRKAPFAGMVNPYTGRTVPGAPEDNRVLYVELVYPFSGRPRELTIVPPLGERGVAKATIGFIAYHKTVPVIDFRYLSAAEKLELDWDDPWYSRFENPNLKRHHKSALMSFLYVEPYEVRHEVLTRVKDLEQWMDLGLSGGEYIELAELGPLKKRVGEFFLGKNAVLVDGKPGAPILDRIDYVKVALSGIQLMEKPERLEISTAILGIIIAYITDGLPREVSVDWELFTDQIQQVPTMSVDPAGPLPSFLTPDDNVLVWKNFLKKYKLPKVEELAVDESLMSFSLPAASIFCLLMLLPIVRQGSVRRRDGVSILLPLLLGVAVVVGSALLYPYGQVALSRPAAVSPTLAEADVEVILHALLKNVYRAFDFREEGDVYDKLALSVSGDLLTDVYLQSRKSFEVKKAGGAQAKVKEVEILEAEGSPRPDGYLAYACKAKWTALGTVGHWGHVHSRKNLYDANITIEAADGAWKITELELLEEERIDPYATQAAPTQPSG